MTNDSELAMGKQTLLAGRKRRGWGEAVVRLGVLEKPRSSEKNLR